MPAAFDKCVRDGGKVRTKKLSGGRTQLICFPKGGGDAVAGHIRQPKKKPKKTK